MYRRCSSFEETGPCYSAGAPVAESPAGTRGSPASPDGRIIFSMSGLISVTIAEVSWVLPPQRVLWAPQGTACLASARGGAPHHLRLPFDRSSALPASVCLFEASPLLRELLIEGERLANEPRRTARADWVFALILSELRERPAVNASIAAPRDARLAKLCEAILADPANNNTIDEWARFVGMSRRALTRAFRAETRMSFVNWRRQVRLQAASARLMMGQSVTRVAYEVGYESVATFSSVFRQNFGTSPSRYSRLG